MARRFGTEKVHIACSCQILGFTIPANTGLQLVDGDPDTILSPKLVVLSGDSAGPVEGALFASSGVSPDDIVLHWHIGTNNSRDVTFPEGLELPKGSGIFFQGNNNPSSVTLYYTRYDEAPGITKVASRSSTYGNAATTRTPSNVKGQDKS